MLAYQRGSEEAFDRLVEAYSGAVYALFTRFLGPSPEREDLVQEVFLRVIRSRASYRPTARFATWLYRIAFNLSVNHAERARSRTGPVGRAAEPGELEELEDPAAADPSAACERGGAQAAVRAALARLPRQQRMALILAKYEELSLAEIAEVLGSSEPAVKSLLFRARESLRRELAPFFQEEAS
jgi:RNA polymerase sigma-70 factor (ECF subfamily)